MSNEGWVSAVQAWYNASRENCECATINEGSELAARVDQQADKWPREKGGDERIARRSRRGRAGRQPEGEMASVCKTGQQWAAVLILRDREAHTIIARLAYRRRKDERASRKRQKNLPLRRIRIRVVKRSKG
jgi:hypothetical protein